MQVKQLNSITNIDAQQWNSIAGETYPFIRHEFLSALEQSGAVTEQTGWVASHLLVFEGGDLLGFMPLYLKRHSRGEYVFDQQWAQAYGQHGLNYYPKGVTAIPFTPCPGARICVRAPGDRMAVFNALVSAVKAIAEENALSSWHLLFPEADELDLLRAQGLSIREGVQFHWYNRGYGDFNDFLQGLNASKRKMIKRERLKISEQGVELQRVFGPDVTVLQWETFFRFYALTYLKKGSHPYLNLDFFKQIAATMGEQLLLILAIKNNEHVGAALSFVGSDTLYGRYWGCHAEYNSLHFEACYYQGLDYCIENGLHHFDSGAQGEHKIARGFEPITTYSAHWIKDARFAEAIAQFLTREQQAIQQYKQAAAAYLPFKQAQ